MPYIIRNADGKICGITTGEPGADNRHPDGVLERERTTFVEDGEESKKLLAEILEFRSAVNAQFELGAKREAALRAMQDQALAQAAKSANAPSEVMEHAKALAKQERG